MTVDQEKALLSIDEMLSELLGGLNLLVARAERSQEPDDDLCGALRGLSRIARLAGHEVDIATGAARR